MKKIMMALMGLILCINANAHIFDGIDLNADKVKVTRAISQKGYISDPTTGKLKGNCQGTEILLSFNFDDTISKNKIGQLIVEVPMAGADALKNAAMVFNVIYHQTESNDGILTYSVSDDGTVLKLSAIDGGIKLVYNTPFYEKK